MLPTESVKERKAVIIMTLPTSILKLRGSTTVTLDADHDPDRFYQSRSGLWVNKEFRRLVVVNAKRSEKGTTHKVDYYGLRLNLTDTQIEDGLAQHLFTETAGCAIIAGLMAKQPNGEEGALLNDGNANLFYTASCAAHVSWNSNIVRWNINCYSRSSFSWFAGYQVFSPARA